LIEAGLPNLLVTGTCLEYGLQSGALSEDAEVCPTTPYGFAKDMLRRQLEFKKRLTPFNLTWARLFYLYGEGQAESSLLPQLKRAMQNGERIFNMSKGDQLRDYLPVEELAKYLVSLGLSPQDRGIVNVCSGKPVSVRELVERWIEENSWNIDLNPGYYPYPSYEPMAFWGDRRKLDRCLTLQ
jgi:dTDP-6-deoxy-L-talose 4-dehydrogenase (NAD+)